MSSRYRPDRSLFPGCVRVHLVMHGKHVGYVIVKTGFWLAFLVGESYSMFPSTKKLIETLEKQIADERVEHARERAYILSENKRLCDEVERLRLALGQPSRAAEAPPEPEKELDPDEMPTFRGTPWQQVMQREAWLQGPAGKKWTERQVAMLKVQPSGEIAVMQNKEN